MTNPTQLLLRVPVPWVFVLAYLAGLVPQHFLSHGHPSAPTISIVKISGIALFLLGAIIAGWGLILFHRGGTTTTPGRGGDSPKNGS